MGPYDDLVAALDRAAELFGVRKTMLWALEWALAREPAIGGEPAVRLSIDPAARARAADGGTLGPCGCVDYHYADCPTVTDRFGPLDPPDPDDWDGR